MKVIIAGSRHLKYMADIERAISESGFEITEVVSGCANGADAIGQTWAMGKKIPVKRFPAEWHKLGPGAGPARNQQMADYADALIALPAPDSKGTRDMIRRAEAKGLRVHVYELAS